MRSLAATLALVVVIAAAPATAAAFRVESPMAPRLQWNANRGYCGETAYIAAGMTFGQYTSQWTARGLAAPGLRQTAWASQLLLDWPGGDWRTAATAMRLRATGFDHTQYEDASPTYAGVFLSWVKRQFLDGGRVIIGVLDNAALLGEAGAGDPVYDHIVPVQAIASSRPLVARDDPGNAADYEQRYYGDDVLTIGDNGLFTPIAGGRNFGAGNTAGNPRGSTLYSATFDGIQRSRAEANRFPRACLSPAGDVTNACAPWVYSLYDNATGLGNYGVAITGVVDSTPGGPVVAPVSLRASVNHEGRQDQAWLRRQPAGAPMSLTATVTIPDPARAYRVYLYTSFADVPTGSFNAAAAAHPGAVARAWTIPAGSGATWTTTLASASTAGTYVFRAVPADAP